MYGNIVRILLTVVIITFVELDSLKTNAATASPSTDTDKTTLIPTSVTLDKATDGTKTTTVTPLESFNNSRETNDVTKTVEPTNATAITECKWPSIPNGNCTGDNNTVGSSITITCDPGYNLTSNETLVCLENGNWSGQITCDLIEAGYNSTCDINEQCQTTNATCIKRPVTCEEKINTTSCSLGYCLCQDEIYFYLAGTNTCEDKLLLGNKFTITILPEELNSVKVNCSPLPSGTTSADAFYVEINNTETKPGYFNITEGENTTIYFEKLASGTWYKLQIYLAKGGIPSTESQSIDVVTQPNCTNGWYEKNVTNKEVTLQNDLTLQEYNNFEYFAINVHSPGTDNNANYSCVFTDGVCTLHKNVGTFQITGLHSGSPYNVSFQTAIRKYNDHLALSANICQTISGYTVPGLPKSISIPPENTTDSSFVVMIVPNEQEEFKDWRVDVYTNTQHITNQTQPRTNISMLISDGIEPAMMYYVSVTTIVPGQIHTANNMSILTRPRDSNPAYVSNATTSSITLSFVYNESVHNFTDFVVIVNNVSVEFNGACENESNICTFNRSKEQLIISNLSSGSLYSVTVFTAVGGIMNIVPQIILKYTVPSTPTQVQIPILLIYETSFTVNFTMPDSRYKYAEIKTCAVGSYQCFTSNTTNNTTRSIVLNNLTGGTNYSITVAAIVGDHIKSAESEAQFSATAPLPPIVAYIGSEVNSIALNLSIENEALFDDYFINVEVEAQNRDPQRIENVFNMSVPKVNTTAIIQNLLAGSKYTIDIFTVLHSVNSERHTIITTFTRPLSILNSSVNITHRTNSSLSVSWNPIDEGHVDGYNVVFTCQSPNDNESTFSSSYTASPAEITRLDPGTFCNISVETYIKNGQYGNLTGETVSKQLLQSTQEEAPGHVTNVSSINITSTSVQLQWSQPTLRNGIIRQYMVIMKLNGTDTIAGGLINCTDCSKSDGGLFNISQFPYNTTVSYSKLQTSFSFDFKKLHPYRNYTYFISAFTEAQGPEVTATFETNEDIPGAPVDVEHKYPSHSEIYLTWKPPLERNGVVVYYNIKYTFEKLVCRGKGDVLENYTHVTNTSAVLRDSIYPYWNYNIWINATNTIGTGDYSDLLNITTPEKEPSSDINTTSSNSVTSSSANITWLDPCFSNGILTNFYVELTNTSSKEHTAGEWVTTFDAPVQDHHLVLKDLLPFRNYSVRVKASNSAGNGSYNTNYTFQTDIAVPDVPAAVENGTVTSYSIVVNWKRAIHFTGPTRYTVMVVDTRNKSLVYDITTHTGLWTDELANTSTVTGLDAFWNYSVTVIAETSYENKHYRNTSEPVMINTAEDLPGKVQNLTVEPERDLKKPRQLYVSWDPPAERDLNGIILKYEINCTNGKTTIYTNPTNRSLKIPLSIDSVRNVTVQVRAATSIGLGEQYESTVEVEPGAPEKAMEESNNPLTKKADISVTDDMKMIAVLLPKTFLCNHNNGKPIKWGVIVAQDSMANDLSFVGSITDYEPHKAKYYKKWSDVKDKDDIPPYLATDSKWDPHCRTETSRRRRDVSNQEYLPFIVGDNDCSNNNGFCNGPLQPGRSYRVKSYACTNTGCTETLYSHPIETAPNLIPAILGGLAAAVVVIAVVAVIVYTKRTNKLCFSGKTVESGQSEGDVEINDVATQAAEYIFKPGSVQLSEFPLHVDRMHKDSNLLFADAFKMLRDKSPAYPVAAAEAQQCRPKNRYTNIMPFDQSRVKLRALDDVEGSDFINANFIPGYTSRREYIATQGPMQMTFDDFWRMIWEQNVDTIVMLTKLVEKGRIKCDQYWPNLNDPVYYGELVVSIQSESSLSDYTLRIFEIKSSKGPSRFVKHFWYLKWPDMGCPDDPQMLLDFVKAVKEHTQRPGRKSPTVVHCSAGVGRTGTFIAVDHLLQHIRDHDNVDIFQLVLDMREHRCNMVQTEDQFIYIHECLKAFITTDVEEEEPVYQNTEFGAENVYENAGFQTEL